MPVLCRGVRQMTFDAFKAKHRGADFASYADFVIAMDKAGLEGEDRQKAYQAWRMGWSKASQGGEGELTAVRAGRIKQWR